MTRDLLYRSAALALALLAASIALPAAAQDLQQRDVAPPAPPIEAEQPASEEEIGFSSQTLEYDSEADIVTAAGDVRMVRAGNRLRADRVVWNRKTGEVRAIGDVAITNPGGDTAYGDSVELTESLRDGAVEDLLVVLDEGGRLAAARGTRTGDIFALERAAYTPCRVTTQEGCETKPKEPTWKLTAVRVVYDAGRKRVRYEGARLSLFGVSILPLPLFSHTVGGEPTSGVLAPDLRYDRINGFEVAVPYYVRLAPDRDLTITPHLYTEALPMLEAQYRALTNLGAFQVTGFGTYGRRRPLFGPDLGGEKDFRGYLDTSGRFQFDSLWSLTFSGRVASDKTFLRRYDISRDDRLRSVVNLERITPDSYFSVAGWATQTLRAITPQGQQPFALPVIDYRRRFTESALGGVFEVQGNSLALTRTAGQDTQRAFASARYDVRRITSMGQELSFTAMARGDLYHTDEILRTANPAYRGDNGFSHRLLATAALDLRWPFVGEAFGGFQRITPRIQLVGSPVDGNLRVPNEDARAVDLEDSNLFALNRFPGYDRYEDGARVTYGLDYAIDRPGFSLDATIGQSYRLDARPSLFPEGTGLTDRTSDIVGRTALRYRRFVTLTHRYRLDKDNLKIRRNEVDATIGGRATYATIGYLRLDRDTDFAIEDLRDREEVRLGGRLAFARYWSVFGSTTIDLTGRGEDPLSIADGYEPVRHRLGLAYDDECFEFALTWRRDYENTGDARRGNTYLLRLAFKGLGR